MKYALSKEEILSAEKIIRFRSGEIDILVHENEDAHVFYENKWSLRSNESFWDLFESEFMLSVITGITAEEALAEIPEEYRKQSREHTVCPVCGKYEFEYEFDVCEVCGWEHDLVQEEDPDYRAGPNLRKSLNMCKKEWEEHRTEKTQAICCMFARENAEAAETQSRFDRVESISDSYRYSSELLRCRLCGAYVIRKYVETACYMPGEDWDDAECTMIYYPTSGPEETAQLEEETPLGLVPGDRVRLEVSWRESKPSRKSYRFCGKVTGGE